MNKIKILKTLADVVEAVDEKNIKVFLTDFENWLAMHITMKSTKGIIESEPTLEWIDDGKNDITIKVHIVKDLKPK